MKDFCCRVCGSKSYEEIDLGHSAHYVPSTVSKIRRIINQICICNGCSDIFYDPKKFSLTVKQQKERKRILAKLDDVVSDSMSVKDLDRQPIHKVYKRDG